MTESPDQPQKEPTKTENQLVPETFPLGWPSSDPQLSGLGVQPMLPGLPTLLGVQHTQVWQGQFPPPDAVERYEKVLPGAFNRIITMAERQQEAGIERSKQANIYRHADVKRAHYLGAAVTTIALIFALIALKMGSLIVAGAFLSVPVLSVGKAILDSVRPASRVSSVAAKPDSKKQSENDASP